MASRTLGIMQTYEQETRLVDAARVYTVELKRDSKLNHLHLTKLNSDELIFPSTFLQRDDFFIGSGDKLRESTGEYVGIEVTDLCNLGCKHCFNTRYLKHNKSAGNYMSESTAEALADAMANSYRYNGRVICLSGGEPTINSKKLVKLTKIFSKYDKNTLHIPTNGTGFPLDYDNLNKFLDKFPESVYWQVSYDNFHIPFFAKKKGKEVIEAGLPFAKEDPLLATIVHVAKAIYKRDKRLDIRITTRPGQEKEAKDLEKRLHKALGMTYKDKIYDSGIASIHHSDMAFDSNGNQISKDRRATEICDSGEELYIDSDGKMWPTHHWKASGKCCIGDLVWLEHSKL